MSPKRRPFLVKDKGTRLLPCVRHGLFWIVVLLACELDCNVVTQTLILQLFNHFLTVNRQLCLFEICFDFLFWPSLTWYNWGGGLTPIPQSTSRGRLRFCDFPSSECSSCPTSYTVNGPENDYKNSVLRKCVSTELLTVWKWKWNFWKPVKLYCRAVDRVDFFVLWSHLIFLEIHSVISVHLPHNCNHLTSVFCTCPSEGIKGQFMISSLITCSVIQFTA